MPKRTLDDFFGRSTRQRTQPPQQVQSSDQNDQAMQQVEGSASS